MTKPEAGSRSRKRRVLRGCLTVVFGIVGLSLSLIGFAAFAMRFDCVVLADDFYIGRATVFSSLVGFDPDLAIRYPDGRLFVRGDRLMQFWDQNSFAGLFERPQQGPSDRYVYISGLGIIRESQQPELYEHWFNLKMTELRPGKSGYDANLYHVYSQLKKDPANRRSWCRTAWFRP